MDLDRQNGLVSFSLEMMIFQKKHGDCGDKFTVAMRKFVNEDMFLWV